MDHLKPILPANIGIISDHTKLEQRRSNDRHSNQLSASNTWCGKQPDSNAKKPIDFIISSDLLS